MIADKENPQKHIILAISAVLSILLTLVYYPGILYSDSYARWNLAFRIFQTGSGVTRLTIVPSLWMGFTYMLTQNFASFSLLQSFLFFYSSLYLIKIMGHFQRRWILLPILMFISFPLFQGYSVYHESSIGTIIGINFMLILFSLENKNTDKVKCCILFFLYLLVFSTIFGFRQNTITILPVVIFVLFRKIQPKKIIIVQLLALIIALIFIYTLPDILFKYRGIKKMDEIGIGLAWETAQIIKRTHDPKYDHYLDYAGNGTDATKNSLINVEEDIWQGLINKNGLVFSKVIIPETSRRIQRDYLKIILDHPKDFFENKVYSAGRMLGIPKPLAFYEFDENRWNHMASYGYRFTVLRHQHFERIQHLMGRYRFLSEPFIIFIIGLFFVCIGKRYFKNDVRYLGTVFSLAIFYYLGFLIITERYEFRYFFPSFYLISVIFIVITTKIFESQRNIFNRKKSQ